MRIHILTLFPDMFTGFLSSPLVQRAKERDLLHVEVVDIKDFAEGSFRKIDDSPYGGGAGMVLRCDVAVKAMESVSNGHRILLSARGTPYNQTKVHELLEKEHIILLCGHYEGVDERVSAFVDEEICIGDYILSGGEVGAMAIVDSLVRLIGTIREESTKEESFENGMLEYPQYTKPRSFRGLDVPEILLSGNHQAIETFRKEQAERITRERRPDLLKKQ